jgi:hypothetical protein
VHSALYILCTLHCTHLRRKVLWGPAEGLCGLPPLKVLFAEAEIRNLDVAILIEQQVLQLEGRDGDHSDAEKVD